MNRPAFSLGDVLFIGLGGAAGSLLRTWIGTGFEGGFPVPTVFINVLGASALAVLYGFEHRLHPKGRYLYMVGFCGSFTTVSLFSFETVQLFENGQAGLALLNLGLPVAVALLVALWLIPRAEQAAGKETA